jgi:hypothetical protein
MEMGVLSSKVLLVEVPPDRLPLVGLTPIGQHLQTGTEFLQLLLPVVQC